MTATIPALTTLRGSHVRLVPLAPSHIAGLETALRRPEVFAGGFGGGAAALPGSGEAFARWIRSYYRPDRHTYVIESASSCVVGATTLGDFEVETESAHIGRTALTPEVWGTLVYPESKLLLLDLAFAHGFGRVKLQADVENSRSRRAIEKLGGVYEGIVRRERRRADGSWRDTAVYSILIEEWDDVRRTLLERIRVAERAASG